MNQPTFRNYVRYSIRFRVLCCVFIAVALGLTLARLSELALTQLRLLPFEDDSRLGLIFFFALLYTALILMSLVSFMLQPIVHLNRRLRQLKTRKAIRDIDPTEFVELSPLVEAAQDFMEWAENQQNLSAMIHHASRKRIEHLAELDTLTGLYNRRYLQMMLPLQITYTANLKDYLSLVMLDVDHFKHYNDTNGHLEGDQVLARIAEILRDSVREQDICCRYGGEEFLIVLPNADGRKALGIAERIRQAIDEALFLHEEDQPKGKITASLGVATYPDHAKTAEELTQYADQAMYLSKQRGRNRTSTYGEIEDEETAKVQEIDTEADTAG